MIHVVVPMGGVSSFPAEGYLYPKPLIEVRGKILIERVLQGLKGLDQEIHYHFILNKKDIERFHLDKTLKLLTDGKCSIRTMESETKGAACSVLLCAGDIPPDAEVVIVNSDNILELSLADYIKKIRQDQVDAAVLHFSSVHPRWSYVLANAAGEIIEAREKNPISKKAIAGFYYFSRFSHYLEASMTMIKKDAMVDGRFFIAPALNELILRNRKLKTYEIPPETSFIIYSEEKLKEYENFLDRGGRA